MQESLSLDFRLPITKPRINQRMVLASSLSMRNDHLGTTWALEQFQMLCITLQIIQTSDLPDEITLATIAWVPNLHDFSDCRQPVRSFRGIVPNGHKAARTQHCN